MQRIFAAKEHRLAPPCYPNSLESPIDLRAKIQASTLPATSREIAFCPWAADAAGRSALDRLNTIMEAPVTSGTEAVITLRPDVDDRVPSEALPPQSIGDPASMSSFPKVLRRRLDKFLRRPENLSQSRPRDVAQSRRRVLRCCWAVGLPSTRLSRIHGSLSPSTSSADSPRHFFC